MASSSTTFHQGAPAPTAAEGQKRRLPWNFAEWFVLSQTFFPALLYLPHSQPFRVEIRMASYGVSLGALIYYLFIRKEDRTFTPYPSVPWLLAVLCYLGLMLMHPQTNSFLAGAAQIGLYLCIMSPIFWVPAFIKETARLKRVLWLLLLCNGINSFVGVMQVLYPYTWMPSEFSSINAHSEYGFGTVIYYGANGDLIVRPPGLGDSPGEVCGPASFALYLGLVFAGLEGQWWKKVVAGIFASLGAAAIFFTLVRSVFLITLGMIGLYVLLQIIQQRYRQAASVCGIGIVAITLAFLHSSSIGGQNLSDRFASIFADDPVTFYNENRGVQVENSIATLLPEYPYGAGLGRWGMMNVYFGNPDSLTSPPIWVEIQIPAWIVDGGIVLLILYPVALAVAIRHQTLLVFNHRDPEVRSLATIILAANAGILALCLSYPVFLAPIGAQFWFLSGALRGVAMKFKMPPAKHAGLLPGTTFKTRF
jgi:hypothetical protein